MPNDFRSRSYIGGVPRTAPCRTTPCPMQRCGSCGRQFGYPRVQPVRDRCTSCGGRSPMQTYRCNEHKMHSGCRMTSAFARISGLLRVLPCAERPPDRHCAAVLAGGCAYCPVQNTFLPGTTLRFMREVVRTFPCRTTSCPTLRCGSCGRLCVLSCAERLPDRCNAAIHAEGSSDIRVCSLCETDVRTAADEVRCRRTDVTSIRCTRDAE